MAANTLTHYGVKGQRWGVVKEKDKAGFKKLQAAHKNKLKAINETPDAKEARKAYQHYAIFGDYGSYRTYATLNKKVKSQKKAENNKYNSTLKEKFPKEYQKKQILKGAAITAGILAGTALVTVTVAKTKKTAFLVNYASNEFKAGLGKVKIKDLMDDDTFVSKGTKFHRMSSKENEDYNNAKRIYASYKKEDINRYKSVMPDFLKKWEKEGHVDSSTMYEHILEANVDIKSPSHKKRVQAFSDLLKNDTFVESLEKEYGGDFKSLIKSVGADKVAEDNYKNFAASLTNDKSGSVKLFFDKIKDAGYNAIVDDNDRNKLSNTPMILLDPNDSLVKVGSKKVNALNIIIAELQLKNVT